MKTTLSPLAVAAALALASPAPSAAAGAALVGYGTGAVADRAQYDQVVEAEDLVRAGNVCPAGLTVVGDAPSASWMAWITRPGACVFATIAAPSDTIVFQTAGSDLNDGQMLVYVDDALVASVDLYPPVSGGAPFYVQVSGLPVQPHRVRVVAGPSESGSGTDHVHLDFIAAVRTTPLPAVPPSVARIGYGAGAVADRAQYAQVIEGEDLVRAGNVCPTGLTVIGDEPWSWMAWITEPGACVFATLTTPSDRIVVQTAGADANDGQMLVYVDGDLVDSVDLNPVASGGAPFYVEVSRLPVQPHGVMVVAGPSASSPAFHDVHLDFVAARPNRPPVVHVEPVAPVFEGSAASAVITASDPDGDPVVVSVSQGTLSQTAPGAWRWTATFPEGPATERVLVTADDGYGPGTPVSFTVDVVNVGPGIGGFSATASPVAVGSTVTATGTVTDPGVLDTHAVRVEWGDGTSSSAAVAQGRGVATFEANHVYAQPGLYAIRAVANDDDGGLAAADWSQAIVYDPAGRFLTAGGWFPSASGAVTFGVSAKYRGGAVPVGTFTLDVGGGKLVVSTTTLDWLVVSGSRAWVAGKATVAGVGPCTFSVAATDGGANSLDAFSVELRDAAGAIVFAGAGTNLAGGSVQLH